MKKTIKALRTPAIVLLLITSFIACDKDFYVIESDVLGKDNANFNVAVDSFPIVSYNKKLDSLQVNNLPSNLLGFFNDPEFGPTTASIVSQVVPTNFSHDFGTDPILDSVVLRIPYFSRATGIDDEGFPTYTLDSIYGSKNDSIKVSVYENTYFLRDLNPDNLGENQKYFSHASNVSTDNFVRTNNALINFDDFKGPLLKGTTFVPSSNPTITYTSTDTLRTTPSFRIKLDSTFWQTTIIGKNGQPELSNSNNFKNYFRGLYFKSEAVEGKGNMMLFNLASTDANITIYYSRVDSSDENERVQDEYALNFNGNRLNTFINSFNMPFTNGNRILGDEKLYLKGAEGSMAIVDLFPTEDGLNDFIEEFRIPDGNNDYLKDNTTGDYILDKLINEAHLVVYEDDDVNTGGEDKFHRYDRIYAYDINNNIPIIDYLVDPTDNVVSPVSSKVIHLTQRDTIEKNFKIRITEHLNNILLRDSTNTKIGLVLSTNVNLTGSSEILNSQDNVTGIPSAAILTPRGTVLYGTNVTDPQKENKKMKLKLFFTEPK